MTVIGPGPPSPIVAAVAGLHRVLGSRNAAWRDCNGKISRQPAAWQVIFGAADRCSCGCRRRRDPLDVGVGRQHIPLMTDPFVQPAEPSAAAAIEAINDELCLFDDWMDRYEFIIGMGRKLPPFPDDWTNDAHRVPGCQSRVWMEAIPRDGKLYFAGLSDAAIVSGLVALLLRVYSGRSADEIIATDPVFLKDLGLLEALSTNRGNGIAAMARKLREVATMQRAA
jgi:cysteine desulfuration protein SufE